jgi:protein SCO1/2
MATATPPALENLFSGGFDLVDHNGEPRTHTDFRGRYLLIYFGYNYCPTICPTNLQHMALALQTLGRRAQNVQPLFISIDPARDTPNTIKEYVANFGERFLGLTGSEKQVRAAAKASRVHRHKVIPDKTAPEDYLVDHSSLTLLIGPDGKFLTLVPHDTSGAVMAQRMVKYLD